jgi:hypothetical protein
MPETAPQPTPERKPAWRAAVLAYRKVRRAGGGDHQAHLAARAAVLGVWPTLSVKEASAEAVNAVAFASSYHTKWFWSGVGALRD